MADIITTMLQGITMAAVWVGLIWGAKVLVNEIKDSKTWGE